MKNRSLNAIRAKRKSSTSGGLAKNSPVVRGEINDVILREKGTNYGSEILNFEVSIHG